MDTFGSLVRATRERKGIRAADLAYQIGKDPSYLSKLERDILKDIPPPDVLAGLERELGLPQIALLRALGYGIPTGPVPAYPADEVRVLAECWPQFTAEERQMTRYILDSHLKLRGEEGVDNLVRSVDDPPRQFRRSVAG
jgi:transcriptional regulator with XRE-family HTH domain